MALKFLIDLLTGNLVLVQIPSTTVTPPAGMTGQPMGLLLALTYAS